MNKKTIVITTVILAVMIIISTIIKPKYYINLSCSIPRGIYKVIPFDGQLKPGDIVIFDPPVQARPYVYGRAWLPKGWPLIKPVGAITGDEYQIKEHSIIINNHYKGPVYSYDKDGQPINYKKGRFIVEKEHFLPISTYIKRSFDGRYFGQVPYSLIRGKAKLIIKL
ncbi:MAG TPA: S26 family signal peptidase [Defluviitaleaceae bacterium]|jgi:conjugative transfer signal peptidase TraF|nr:S26 family signal peptidase [Defluviitaleaceae bacterium]